MNKKDQYEQNTTHGNIVNFKGFSFERIVIYICITIITVIWLLYYD